MLGRGHERLLHLWRARARAHVLTEELPALDLVAHVGVVVQAGLGGHGLGVVSGHRHQVAGHLQGGGAPLGPLLVGGGDEGRLGGGGAVAVGREPEGGDGGQGHAERDRHSPQGADRPQPLPHRRSLSGEA